MFLIILSKFGSNDGSIAGGARPFTNEQPISSRDSRSLREEPVIPDVVHRYGRMASFS